MAPETELVTKVRALIEKRHGDHESRSLRRTFESYDRNRSGSLEADELADMLTDAGVGNKLTRGFWVRGILSQLADDGDALSWNELESAVEAA